MSTTPRDASAYLTAQFDQLAAALAAGDDATVEKICGSFARDGHGDVAATVRNYMNAYFALRDAVTATDKAAIVDAVLHLERLGAIGVTRAMLSAAGAAA
jgi:hypothetical protein